MKDSYVAGIGRSSGRGDHHTTNVELSTPLWRIVAVAAACGSIAALAYWLNAVHQADDFATVAVITIAFTISFWARQRPDRVHARFGPFGRIASAIRDSQDDLRRWVYNKPLRSGAMIAACYGIAVVIAKHLVILAVHALWSPWLAVAVGAALGAIVAAPRMFGNIARRLAGQPADDAAVNQSGNCDIGTERHDADAD